MGVLLKSLVCTMLTMLTLYSILNLIENVDGRFLWDLSSYCINYCSRVNDHHYPPIGVCSCHRIASFHRRMTFDLDHPPNPSQ